MRKIIFTLFLVVGTFIWSDAMRNKMGKAHSINYLWNQMEINIQL